MSNVPPAIRKPPCKRRQGRMLKMSDEAKARRAAKRQRQRGTEKDWRARTWARKHILSEPK